ncbi:MAG TPA: phage holin family protein [Nocardioidaceae bacterium]|nr:phage holin family protein [Nocardioidaceae bacterium]
MTSNAPLPQSTPAHRRVDVPSKDDPTIGRLVADASRDISTLIHKEIELAKSELKISVKAGGIGAALFAVAGFLGVLGIIVLSIAVAFFIHFSGLDLAWCFLIVCGGWFLLAAILALVGIRKVKQVRAPERAIHEAQEAKGLLKRG